MATGPQRARLDIALSGAVEDAVVASADEWWTCIGVMDQIAAALSSASPTVKEQIGGSTGPAVDAAFARSSRGMAAKSQELAKGRTALNQAAAAIRAGRRERDALAGQPLTEPAPYRPPVGQPTTEDLHEEARSRQQHAAYATAYADQERRAQEQADHMDRVFEHSAAVMKEIHGVPDPEQRSDGAGGGAGGPSGGPRGAGAPALAQSPRPPSAGGSHGPGYLPGGAGPQGGGHQPGESLGEWPGNVSGPVLISPPGTELGPATGLGVVGAAAGGLGGGLLATGLAGGGIRPGGLASIVSSGPGQTAGGVRGIGATARSGASGALGRPGTAAAVGPGSATTRAGAAARTGRSGRAGVGGTAGAAGRRGTSGEKRRAHEQFDVGEDWVDDEDAAPGVLD